MSEHSKLRFKSLTEDNKQSIWNKRKAKNTNDATEVWVNCLKDYLSEKQLPQIDLISNEQLADVLCDFYVEVKKKKTTDNDVKAEIDVENVEPQLEERCCYYKTTTLRAIRGALTRYFKDTRKLDIRNNELFIEANEMFIGKTKDNKEKWLGQIENKPPINDADMSKLISYFQSSIREKANPKVLQQSVIFNIIYYLCRRGRENLRAMQKTTFEIALDPENNLKYIYQAVDEADKNHSHNDTSIANQGRIYELPGRTYILFSTQLLDF